MMDRQSQSFTIQTTFLASIVISLSSLGCLLHPVWSTVAIATAKPIRAVWTVFSISHRRTLLRTKTSRYISLFNREWLSAVLANFTKSRGHHFISRTTQTTESSPSRRAPECPTAPCASLGKSFHTTVFTFLATVLSVSARMGFKRFATHLAVKKFSLFSAFMGTILRLWAARIPNFLKWLIAPNTNKFFGGIDWVIFSRLFWGSLSCSSSSPHQCTLTRTMLSACSTSIDNLRRKWFTANRTGYLLEFSGFVTTSTRTKLSSWVTWVYHYFKWFTTILADKPSRLFSPFLSSIRMARLAYHLIVGTASTTILISLMGSFKVLSAVLANKAMRHFTLPAVLVPDVVGLRLREAGLSAGSDPAQAHRNYTMNLCFMPITDRITPGPFPKSALCA